MENPRILYLEGLNKVFESEVDIRIYSGQINDYASKINTYSEFI